MPNIQAIHATRPVEVIPPKQYGEGRKCSKKGCTTRLHKYNPSDRCSLHPRPPAPDKALMKSCKECGRQFIASSDGKRYCDDVCKRQAAERVRRVKRKRKREAT